MQNELIDWLNEFQTEGASNRHWNRALKLIWRAVTATDRNINCDDENQRESRRVAEVEALSS